MCESRAILESEPSTPGAAQTPPPEQRAQTEPSAQTRPRGPEALSAAPSHEALPLHLNRILVPLDFSRLADGALSFAIGLAKSFGAKITLLHVIQPLPYPADLGYLPMGETIPLAPVQERLDATAEDKIPPEALAHCVVRLGIPFEVIADVAREEQSDLIVITTHGYTGLKRALLGSTAERIIRHAPCPVLTVRSPRRPD